MSPPRRQPGRVPGTRKNPHTRKLIGPNEILERIKRAGGVPEQVLDGLISQEPDPATEAAGDRMRPIMEATLDEARAQGGSELSFGDDPTRRMAWYLSVTNSMKESAPRERWCRHIRAADPRVTEIRSVALLSRGVWSCVECLKQAGPKVLEANLWPDECDLCGAKTQRFSEFAGQVGGIMITANVCSECSAFLRDSSSFTREAET
jgi:hypothetical protein